MIHDDFGNAGRVNLIGEHIDYEGYSVLPMAIRQDTIIGIRKNNDSGTLRIANVNDKYTMCTYPADPNQVYNISLFGFNLSILVHLVSNYVNNGLINIAGN